MSGIRPLVSIYDYQSQAFHPETTRMTPPTNGITPEVIREMMPPYHLSADLLAAAFASIPPPSPDATQAWRQKRAARLVQEIAGLMPADAPQARIRGVARPRAGG